MALARYPSHSGGAAGSVLDVFAALADRLDPEVFEAPASAVVRLRERDGAVRDLRIDSRGARLLPPGKTVRHPDAILTATAHTWHKLSDEIQSGMNAYREGRLEVRGNLHVGVGFLAATARSSGPGRLRFRQLQTGVGSVSILEAGRGDPVIMAHGLGATKASFLPTVSALAVDHRCIAMDLPGFGDSDKPLFAAYDPRFFATWIVAVLDALHIRKADVLGHSMGGRAAIEVALEHRRRVDRLVLLTPSLAWRRNREWSRLLRFIRPELGMLQITPRPVVERILDHILPEAASGWAAAGKDEFLRSYMTPAGRAAFYAAARQIYLEPPDGERGFWTRLSGLSVPSLWVWGKRDRLVPEAFRRHVIAGVPDARHVSVDCGHVPQLERPREVHAAIRDFLD
jgi:pimeloyl-ACP methyl ester carboxylesterase